ncbi:CDP-glycerol glycerophosphotransferase family protein [Aeromicrobium sp. 50.2.37]|uniref:CDP-glycerol glycerophosphotransferase family protein n=1 Tax=Aeromicrobium sp. 50.2.37 TaxID=2969305 RepID=UPI00214FC42A|nr:CDP-glycerol glycerophosphotransferase family protein [Aeromicrobium sp. 50.2.37]MCR4512519.1 CDP-glycerol glycerophosphotransferase family protein [Aeromicrobium sp. 50.2.37]
MLSAADLERAKGFVDAIDVDADSGTVTLHAHLRVPDTRVDERPGLEAELRLGDVRVAARWVERPDRRVRYGPWSALVAEVPLAAWPRGVVRPELAVEGRVLRLRPTRALFRNATPGAHGDVALDVRADGDAVVVELVDGGERAAMRLRRRSDLRAVRRREPLWGWRVVRALTGWMHRRPLWLVGERRDTAQDNGAALFTYLRRHRRDLRAYYVVERGTPAWDRMRPLGRVVAHGSWRHRLLLWHASHLVNAFDPDVYGIPETWGRDDYVRHVRPRVGTRRVFLQHGVVYRDLAPVIGRLVAGYDLVLTSAAAERDWIAGRLGYGDRAVLTGLPRHDLLVREPAAGGPRVLFAPTWRADLVVPSYREGGGGPVEGVEESGYARLVRGVVEHPALAAALARHGAVLEVLPHYEARGLLADLVDDRADVHLVDQDREEFGAVLRRASVLLTDYSSTLFDAALLGLPVVAAHVDPDFEQSGRPHAFEVDEIGIAVVVRDVDAAVAAVVELLEADRRDTAVDAAVDRFFAHAGDQGSAARAVAAIEAMP